jgi:hypothetical protein
VWQSFFKSHDDHIERPTQANYVGRDMACVSHCGFIHTRNPRTPRNAAIGGVRVYIEKRRDGDSAVDSARGSRGVTVGGSGVVGNGATGIQIPYAPQCRFVITRFAVKVWHADSKKGDFGEEDLVGMLE